MSVHEPETVAGELPPARSWSRPRASRGAPGSWLAVVALAGGAGIALLSVSFALARANTDLTAARLIFWAALAAIGGSALARMLAPSASRSERILLVALTALLFYWLKVLHDPVRLFFPDEFFHLANAQRIAQTGELYGENLLLPVSASYPGLPLVTTALSELSGLGLFPCALLIIGLAKVTLSVALFLIFERLSGSARIAGVGALLYCAQPNFLFWSSQFSYESLSLPLLAVVLLCVVAHSEATPERRMAWSAFGCLTAVAVVVTHHLTAYAMVVLLWVHVALLPWRRPGASPATAIAVMATVACVAWLWLVAAGTGDYLGDIFSRAVQSVSRAVDETGGTRAPFQGGGTSAVEQTGAPLDDKLLAVASVLLVGLGVLAGLLAGRRRSWVDPLAVVLAVAAVTAVAVYPLRALPGAWEVSNRTSDFLFIGVASVAALGAVTFVDRGRGRRRTAAIAAAAAVAIAGGAVLGWPGTARLPRAFTADVDGARIEAQGPLMAEWAGSHLPHDSAIVANDTNGRLLSVAGFDRVWAGPTPGVPPLLTFDVLPQWQWDFLRAHGIDYVVLDRRWAGRDNLIGYFYPRPSEADDPPISNWRRVRRKFERLPGARRIFDSGAIVIYDIRRALAREAPPADG